MLYIKYVDGSLRSKMIEKLNKNKQFELLSSSCSYEEIYQLASQKGIDGKRAEVISYKEKGEQLKIIADDHGKFLVYFKENRFSKLLVKSK